MTYYGIYLTPDAYAAYVKVDDSDYNYSESSYNEERFFKDKNGEKLKFDTKEEALEWLGENVKFDRIYPEDRKQLKFNQEDYMR